MEAMYMGMPLGCGDVTCSFAQDMMRASMTMMDGMTIEYTGDVNVDFCRGMIPHHQGAIDMCVVLRDHVDADPELASLCEFIIYDQTQEITFLQNWLTTYGSSLGGGECANHHTTHSPEHSHNSHTHDNITAFHPCLRCDDMRFLVEEQCPCALIHTSHNVHHPPRCDAVQQTYQQSGCCHDIHSPVDLSSVCSGFCAEAATERKAMDCGNATVDTTLLALPCASHMTPFDTLVREAFDVADSLTHMRMPVPCTHDVCFSRHFWPLRQLTSEVATSYFRTVHRSLDVTTAWFAHHLMAQGIAQTTQVQRWLQNNGHAVTSPTGHHMDDCVSHVEFGSIVDAAVDTARMVAMTGDSRLDLLHVVSPLLQGMVDLCRAFLAHNSSTLRLVDLCVYVDFDQSRKLSWIYQGSA